MLRWLSLCELRKHCDGGGDLSCTTLLLPLLLPLLLTLWPLSDPLPVLLTLPRPPTLDLRFASMFDLLPAGVPVPLAAEVGQGLDSTP